MHQIGTKGRDVLLKPCQHALADAKRLDGFLICAGEKMLVVRCGDAEDITQNLRKREVHGYHPFHMRPAKSWTTANMVFLHCDATIKRHC
jgi:hypothetical protein